MAATNQQLLDAVNDRILSLLATDVQSASRTHGASEAFAQKSLRECYELKQKLELAVAAAVRGSVLRPIRSVNL